jgi:hypothetical protein
VETAHLDLSDERVLEAITHAEGVAESTDDPACSREHLRLALWLRELLELRELERGPSRRSGR